MLFTPIFHQNIQNITQNFLNIFSKYTVYDEITIKFVLLIRFVELKTEHCLNFCKILYNNIYLTKGTLLSISPVSELNQNIVF